MMPSSKGRDVRQFGNLNIKTDLPLGEPRLHGRLCSNPEIEKESQNQYCHIYHYFIKYFPKTSVYH